MEYTTVGETAYGKFLTVPEEPISREILKCVDEKTRSEVDLRYGILGDYNWEMNTIANSFLETLISTLKWFYQSSKASDDAEGEISFYDLFSITITNKVNGSAEKEGNLNVKFDAGPMVDDLITNGPPPLYEGEVVKPNIAFGLEDPEDNDFWKKMDYQVKYGLSTRNGIMLSSKIDFVAVAITFTFFKNLFIELIQRAALIEGEDDEEKIVSVNFNDNIEVHCIVKNGTASIAMRPGMNAKLLIKNDEFTESTLGDFED